MKRTVVIAYFDHRHRRLKVPNACNSVNANAAIMRCHWNLIAGVYRNARSAEVYDVETAELFAQFRVVIRKGDEEDMVQTVYKASARNHKDPIRRTSAHALFHDLEIEGAEPVEQ